MINKIFTQSVGQFISSKSNWTSMVMIGFGAYGIYTDPSQMSTSVQMILGGIAVMGIRDAVAK